MPSTGTLDCIYGLTSIKSRTDSFLCPVFSVYNDLPEESDQERGTKGSVASFHFRSELSLRTDLVRGPGREPVFQPEVTIVCRALPACVAATAFWPDGTPLAGMTHHLQKVLLTQS